MGEISNIKLSDFRKFLREIGCVYDRTNGGHEIWTKAGLTRPIVIQTHKDPIPTFILKNILRDLGMKQDDFLRIIRSL
ncbi:MAG: type II toxin-antitoxin system HicA family toxin [Paludibacteraceae bacterium]